MKVLGLFDGISCGQEAFKRANIKIDKYYASEIDKYAISITNYN
jgi:DNA (cytosine-5)-methyltransferase 3A